MPAPSSWIKRQNTALRLRGCAVSLDLAGSRLRLRATLPPKPSDPIGTPAKQQRISTGLLYPEQGEEAIELAEGLSKALERHRIGVEPFDWAPWLRLSAAKEPSVSALEGLSGPEAIELAREWWFHHGKHRHAAESTWQSSYERPLRPLRGIARLEPSHLHALVETTKAKTRYRRVLSTACATVARALQWPEDLVEELLAKGKGYAISSVKAREIPADAVIEAGIDQLPPHWQWAVAMVATYGCRPHEALKYATVLPSGLAKIEDGKTGARQSLALPAQWIQRWDLHQQRRPNIDFNRTNQQVGHLMSQVLLRRKLGFRAYDLRHAWAVRAIHDPRISPSLAAKSMGHSLTMHSMVYQRWFDGSELEGIQALLSEES